MSDITPITVLIVDDHPLFRDGVAALLGKQDDIAVVGEASNGLEAVSLAQELKPDVILMDLQMPGLNGTDATRQILRLLPGSRVLMLTTYKGDVRANEALSAGAAGYALKDTVRKDLVNIIRDIYEGRKVVPPEVAIDLAAHIGDEKLTQREMDVLKFVALGKSNRAVANALGVTEETVKSHMRNVLAKLMANDRTHAVLIAVRRGILSL
jgi:two-component system NarL family response regulator